MGAVVAIVVVLRAAVVVKRKMHLQNGSISSDVNSGKAVGLDVIL